MPPSEEEKELVAKILHDAGEYIHTGEPKHMGLMDNELHELRRMVGNNRQKGEELGILLLKGLKAAKPDANPAWCKSNWHGDMDCICR